MRDMPGRTFITGFLPFGGFEVNPSALLAESLGRRFEVLEVSFAAVDAFLDRLAADAPLFDNLLMLGLRASGTGIDVERLARNRIGPDPDARGEARGPGAIEPDAPLFLTTTLVGLRALNGFSPSDDAGSYLCNYVYYRALRLFPDKRVGFVHLPPLTVLPVDVQRRRIRQLVLSVEGKAAPPVA